MDRFELNWPGADASFYTDGWRCRIVWREKGRRHGGGSMGGTIDNNQQCVKRAAESLAGTPYFLSALKARGHQRLAEQIESAADEAAVSSVPERRHPAPKRAPRRQRVENSSRTAGHERAEGSQRSSGSARVETVPAPQAWLQALEGEASFEPAADKRARAWIELGAISQPAEVLLLKAPAPGSRAEWVLKRTWLDAGKRKPEFVVAASFKGIADYLIGAGLEAEGVEQLLARLAGTTHPELEAAAAAWRAAERMH